FVPFLPKLGSSGLPNLVDTNRLVRRQSELLLELVRFPPREPQWLRERSGRRARRMRLRRLRRRRRRGGRCVRLLRKTNCGSRHQHHRSQQVAAHRLRHRRKTSEKIGLEGNTMRKAAAFRAGAVFSALFARRISYCKVELGGTPSG